MEDIKYNQLYSIDVGYRYMDEVISLPWTRIEYMFMQAKDPQEIRLRMIFTIAVEDPTDEPTLLPHYFKTELVKTYLLASLETVVVNAWFESDLIHEIRQDKEVMDAIKRNVELHLFTIKQALSRLVFTIQRINSQSIK